MLLRQLEGFCIRTAEQLLILLGIPMAVHGTGGMDDELRREVKAGCNSGSTGLDRRNLIAGRLQLGRAGSLENGNTESAANRQVSVGCVDNSIHLHSGYVLSDDCKGHGFTFSHKSIKILNAVNPFQLFFLFCLTVQNDGIGISLEYLRF